MVAWQSALTGGSPHRQRRVPAQRAIAAYVDCLTSGQDPGRAVERKRRARFLKGTASGRPAAGPDGLPLESLRAPPGLALTFRGAELKTRTSLPLKARTTPSTQEG